MVSGGTKPQVRRRALPRLQADSPSPRCVNGDLPSARTMQVSFLARADWFVACSSAGACDASSMTGLEYRPARRARRSSQGRTSAVSKRRAWWSVGAAMVMTLAAACGGGSSNEDASPPETSATETTVIGPEETTTSLPAEATRGSDDLNQDGEPDPVCGTRDLGPG